MGIAETYRGPSGNLLPGLRMDLEEAIKKLKKLFQEKSVPIAYLFGSYICGEVGAASDVDIAVFLKKKGEKLYSSFQKILLGIREALGTERFDLMLLDRAPLSLQFEIVSRGRLIYSQGDELLNAFEMNVIRRFQDTAYLRAVQNEYFRERVRQWYSKSKA
ncbi:type VII toxin-antitoxin system MntA family adenylyltransferase antitoxin [Atrimonas thermophila]|uniref:type VII toxin-antitoxin system MntA family adenylyltransferase antitoxin n=1 Tax=Atrimonas thermophila TaxID=3064161 RepID=UPI00399CBA64